MSALSDLFLRMQKNVEVLTSKLAVAVKKVLHKKLDKLSGTKGQSGPLGFPARIKSKLEIAALPNLMTIEIEDPSFINNYGSAGVVPEHTRKTKKGESKVRTFKQRIPSRNFISRKSMRRMLGSLTTKLLIKK